jgi:hypothetical protein
VSLLTTVPLPEGWVGVVAGLRVVGATDGPLGDGLGAADEALGMARSSLREPRSSVVRLGVTSTAAEAARASLVGPMFIAAAAAPISRPATATAEITGINARDDRRIAGSPCLPDKSPTLRRQQGRE